MALSYSVHYLKTHMVHFLLSTYYVIIHWPLNVSCKPVPEAAMWHNVTIDESIKYQESMNSLFGPGFQLASFCTANHVCNMQLCQSPPGIQCRRTVSKLCWKHVEHLATKSRHTEPVKNSQLRGLRGSSKNPVDSVCASMIPTIEHR